MCSAVTGRFLCWIWPPPTKLAPTLQPAGQTCTYTHTSVHASMRLHSTLDTSVAFFFAVSLPAWVRRVLWCPVAERRARRRSGKAVGVHRTGFSCPPFSAIRRYSSVTLPDARGPASPTSSFPTQLWSRAMLSTTQKRRVERRVLRQERDNPDRPEPRAGHVKTWSGSQKNKERG
jgi:hypothetical protein